jgi:hypothetical protein
MYNKREDKIDARLEQRVQSRFRPIAAGYQPFQAWRRASRRNTQLALAPQPIRSIRPFEQRVFQLNPGLTI